MAELQTDQDPLEHLIAFVKCLRPSMLLEELDTEMLSEIIVALYCKAPSIALWIPMVLAETTLKYKARAYDREMTNDSTTLGTGTARKRKGNDLASQSPQHVKREQDGDEPQTKRNQKRCRIPEVIYILDSSDSSDSSPSPSPSPEPKPKPEIHELGLAGGSMPAQPVADNSAQERPAFPITERTDDHSVHSQSQPFGDTTQRDSTQISGTDGDSAQN